ncbi:MAG: hypothetical protein IPL53_03825 [Ignavibacteria bacterium]|nr:hypothetical protein [Ignavibacteria bacterium]
MKKSLFQFVMLFVFLILVNESAYSANEYFRSIASGNWNNASTWQMSTNSGSTWIPTSSTPGDTSGVITVRNGYTVSVTESVGANQLVVEGGGTISIGSGIILTITDGDSFDLTVVTGGAVTGLGTVRTQGADVLMLIGSGTNFSVPLVVFSGTATARDNSSPLVAVFKGSVTVNPGATLNGSGGGYSIQANSSVTNNGSITGSGGIFRMRGATMVNNGTVSISDFNFDSTTSVSGTSAFTGTNISINSSGNVSFSGNMTFSPVSNFNINSGGVLNPANLTFTSGLMNLTPGGTIANTGTLKTSGNPILNINAGSNFNAPLNIISGTTIARDNSSPLIGIFKGTITINNGAVLEGTGGGYSIQSNGNVINNGTISGSGGIFRMRGASFTNNGVVSISAFNLDSTTTITGTSPFTGSNITINGSGNVSFTGNVTFSPASTFNINSGGVLNPANLTLTSGLMNLTPGGTIANTGTLKTSGNPTLNINAGSNFNAPLNIISGTTIARDNSSPLIGIFKGTITINNGAVLEGTGGGYSIQSNGNVINNGTISGSGGIFRMRGASFVNNGSVIISDLNFDSTTTVSGVQPFTGSNISINGSGNVSFTGNVTFSPVANFNINSGGILNPANLTLTSGLMNLNPGGTVANTGTLKTTGSPTLNIRGGSNFNGGLNVVSGSTTARDNSSPLIAIFKGTITVDTGAFLVGTGGGYSIQAEGNVINNGTVTGSGGVFKFAGPVFTNNGSVNISTFNFETGVHTLQGSGNWTAGTTNILLGSITTLGSNHHMQSININTGGTFNLSTFKLMLSSSNPIINNGSFVNSSGIVEYNGNVNQNISFANITYSRLRINNVAGTVLIGAVSVTDTLSVVVGSLNLSTHILTLSPNGYLTEAGGNTVFGNSVGYITITKVLNAPSSLNVGGLGAVLTTAANLGSTEIRRNNVVQNGLNGNTSILRYFDIIPTNNSGLNATLVFRYDESELNGKTEGALTLFRSTNNGSTWTARGGTVNTVTNSITLTGIDAYSRWSASSVPSLAAQLKVIVEGYYDIANNRLNIRDTVRAYLRNPAAPYVIVDSAKSVIDSTIFSGNFNFTNAVSGSYYIELKQRNSIETWSKNPVPYVLGSSMTYDFTTALTQAYGNNMTLKGTKSCIYSGDVTQNGFVDLTDVLEVFNEAKNFLTGYVVTDVNGNSIVDLTDVLITYNNSINFVSKKTP